MYFKFVVTGVFAFVSLQLPILAMSCIKEIRKLMQLMSFETSNTYWRLLVTVVRPFRFKNVKRVNDCNIDSVTLALLTKKIC